MQENSDIDIDEELCQRLVAAISTNSPRIRLHTIDTCARTIRPRLL